MFACPSPLTRLRDGNHCSALAVAFSVHWVILRRVSRMCEYSLDDSSETNLVQLSGVACNGQLDAVIQYLGYRLQRFRIHGT